MRRPKKLALPAPMALTLVAACAALLGCGKKSPMGPDTGPPQGVRLAGSAVASSNITVRVLPGLSGSTNNVAYDVNNGGDIVGVNEVGGSLRPVLWPAAGSPVDLGVPPGLIGGIARSITDNGYIVGSTAYVTDGSYGTAIMFRPGAPVALPGLAGGTANAWAVNSSGVAVGEARTYTLARRFDAAARWENGAVQNLGKLPTWDLALARGINDDGDIVGVGMAVLNVSFGTAFVWRSGQFTELGSLSGTNGYSIAYAINNTGDVVGGSRRSDNIIHAAMWRNGQVIDLGTMAGGTMSEAFAVNGVGDAAGYAMSADSRVHAALFRSGQVVLLPDPPGAIPGQTIAHGMNDVGQIVGQAIHATTFQTMPILWTVSAAPPASSQLRSTRIDLSARARSGLVTVTGSVTVKDESDSPVSGAGVFITWTRPGGTVASQSGTTDNNGVARFSTSGGRGTYTLTVNNLSKSGYSFDSAHSVLSKSITK